MAIDVRDLESLVRLVREHPEWRDALRRELLTDDLLTIPAAGRIERILESVAARQDRNEAEMAAGFARTQALVDELARAGRETDVRLRVALDEWARQGAATDARLEELARQSAATDARLEELARQAAATDARLEELARQSAETQASLEETDVRFRTTMDEWARQRAEDEARRAEADARFRAEMDALRAAHEQTMARLDAAIERIDANTVGLRELGERMDRRINLLEGRVGNHDGELFEMRYNVGSQLSTILRRARPVSVGDLDRVLDARDDGLLPEDQLRQLQAADFICVGREGKGPDAPEAYAVVEVSRVIDATDVYRAADRAEVMRRCGYPRVYAAVGGESILPNARALARERGVHVLGSPAEFAPAAA